MIRKSPTKVYSLFVILFFVFHFSLFSKDNGFFSENKVFFNQIQAYLYTVTMPFKFPAETKLLYNYPQSNLKLNFFDKHNPTSLALPILSSSSIMRNQFDIREKGFSADYVHKHTKFSFQFLTGYTNNYLNILIPIKINSIFTLSYNMKNLFIKDNYLSNFNLFLQFSSQQWLDSNLFYKKENVSKLDSKVYYINPGISFSAGPFELEGLIEVPMQNEISNQNVYNLNELHGKFGVKWYIQEGISP